MIPFWKLNFPLLFDDYLIQFCRIWRPLLLFYFILVRSTDVLVQANQTLWDFSSPLCVEASKPRFRKLSIKADFYTAASAFLWSLSLNLPRSVCSMTLPQQAMADYYSLSNTHNSLSLSEELFRILFSAQSEFKIFSLKKEYIRRFEFRLRINLSTRIRVRHDM